MKEITTNAGSLVLREDGKPTETINIGLQATTTAGENVVVTGNGKRWLLSVAETTFNGMQYETADSLAYDISNLGN